MWEKEGVKIHNEAFDMGYEKNAVAFYWGWGEGTVGKDGLNLRDPLCTFCIGDTCETSASSQIQVVAPLPVNERTLGNFIITCSPKHPSQTSQPHVRQHHSPSIRIVCGHK